MGPIGIFGIILATIAITSIIVKEKNRKKNE